MMHSLYLSGSEDLEVVPGAIHILVINERGPRQTGRCGEDVHMSAARILECTWSEANIDAQQQCIVLFPFFKRRYGFFCALP
jgi:hypothetical protein